MVIQERLDHVVAVAAEEKERADMGANAKAPSVGLALAYAVPAPDQREPWPPAAHAELEVEATNNALWPLQQAIEQLKIKAAENIILRALTTMRYDKPTRDYYSGVFGQASVDAMMTGAEMTLDELGLSLSNKVSQTQKFKIMEAAETALKVGRNGMPEIELADYTMIIEMLEKGRIKEATWYLNYKSAKKRKYNDEMAAQNQQAQSQSLIDLERAKLDAEIAKIEAKKNATIEQETVLSQLRIQEMQAYTLP